MPLTTAQLQALRTDITVTRAATNLTVNGVTHTLLQWWNTGSDTQLPVFYNQVASPQVLVWNPSVPVGFLKRAVLMTEYIALTVAKQNGYLMLTQGPDIDATDTNVRASFSTIFGASTSLTNLTALAQRAATFLEALFVTSGVSAVFGYQLTSNDVLLARTA